MRNLITNLLSSCCIGPKSVFSGIYVYLWNKLKNFWNLNNFLAVTLLVQIQGTSNKDLCLFSMFFVLLSFNLQGSLGNQVMKGWETHVPNPLPGTSPLDPFPGVLPYRQQTPEPLCPGAFPYQVKSMTPVPPSLGVFLYQEQDTGPLCLPGTSAYLDLSN